MAIITQDGTRIYFKNWGSRQPVVFSHGWPLNGDAWENQMVFLAQNGYRTIAHDRSSQPSLRRQRSGHLRRMAPTAADFRSSLAPQRCSGPVGAVARPVLVIIGAPGSFEGQLARCLAGAGVAFV